MSRENKNLVDEYAINSVGASARTEFKRRLQKDEVFAKLVECAIVDGHTDEEMGSLLNISPSVWELCKRTTEYQNIIASSRKKLKTEALYSARRLANGFTQEERQFITFLDFDEILRRKADLIDALEKDDKQKVRNILKNCAVLDSDKQIKVNVSEKYFPPQKDAIFRILEAFDENTWDKELKRKKTPDKKIVVTISGDHLERLKKQKVDADFIIEG